MNRGHVHHALRRERGRAAEYDCVGDLTPCAHGAKAEEWSCDVENVEPENLFYEESRGYLLPYSVALSDYSPRCIPCHRRKDHRRVREGVLLAMSEQEWLAYSELREQGVPHRTAAGRVLGSERLEGLSGAVAA